MTLKGMHCKDKGIQTIIFTANFKHLVSEKEKSQSKIYYKVDQFLSTMGAHHAESDKQQCISCQYYYTSSKLLSDLYSQELVLKHHVVNLLVFSL